MSVQDMSSTSLPAASVPLADMLSMDKAQQPTAPMSVTYILNSSDPWADKDEQELPSNIAAPVSATAPAVQNFHVDGTIIKERPVEQFVDEKSPIRAVSPAPSTGDAPSYKEYAVADNGTAQAFDLEMKTDDDTIGDLPAPETFKCMNDEFEECRTGQNTMELSRKVISDHFGRNKACTRLITDWPLFCRKHYQRATYNQTLWQSRKITLILRQFNIIEAQFPGTKYTVALKKSEEQRLNTFSRKLASGKSEVEAAAMVAPLEKGKHFEAPVNVLREIEQLNYLGENKTKAEVEGAVTTIRDMLENEETSQVPSIEFLPQLDASGHPFDAGNRTRSTKKASTRISKKGAVAKPSSTKKSPNKLKKKASKA